MVAIMTVGGGGDAHAQHVMQHMKRGTGDDQLTVGDLYDGGDEHIGQTGHRHHAGDDARCRRLRLQTGIPGPSGQGVHIGGVASRLGLLNAKRTNSTTQRPIQMLSRASGIHSQDAAQDHDDSQGMRAGP